MIWESSPWKDSLLQHARILQSFQSKKHLYEEDYVELESTILISFYAIRKLIDAKSKLTTKVMNLKVSLSSCRPTGKDITLMNWHRIDELFDVENFKPVTKDIRFICNQFIHSYIFIPVTNEEDSLLKSILVTSDRERHNYLYQISVDEIFMILNTVANDNIVSQHMTKNPKTGDYDIVSS